MAIDHVTLSLAEVKSLSHQALRASNVSQTASESLSAAIAAAEAEGLHSHGLMRLPTYCEHAKCKKVDGQATPALTPARSEVALVVDARDGFAHPAIDIGFAGLIPAAKKNGVGALAVTNSYNCGVVGYHVERLAHRGLVALAFVNTPAAIAPWGGSKALFGTNPIAFAVPRQKNPPIVIDQSSSVIARGEVMLASKQGKTIPAGWALDKNGEPTTDPHAALAGSMLPAGGYKGAGIAFLVEVMAAALSGATFSFDASSFADNKGGPPRTGQFFIALEPDAFGETRFLSRMETLAESVLSQPGTRLPGSKRLAMRARTEKEGVQIQRVLLEAIHRIVESR